MLFKSKPIFHFFFKIEDNSLTKEIPAKGLIVSNKFCTFIAINIKSITKISENISLSTDVYKTFVQQFDPFC